MNHSRELRLQEGRDYNVRADGAWVFTREYLFARGTCCGSKCLNCPYANSRLKPDAGQTPLESSRPVISMVPSWTETLIHASVNVVGRTRFCIHPRDAVATIPVLGGTKTLSQDFDLKMQEIVRLANEHGQTPLVVLDREENPKEFVERFAAYPCEVVATHVTDFPSFTRDIELLANTLEKQSVDRSQQGTENKQNSAAHLRSFAMRLSEVTKKPAVSHLVYAAIKSEKSIEEIEAQFREQQRSILYFIWRNPWMIVNRNTWIEAVLKQCFPTASLPEAEKRYTEISENDFENEVTAGAILFFSSEPFPFAESWDEIQKLPMVRKARAAVLVDGEVFSWFGIRTIRFLEDGRSAFHKT